MRRARVAPSPHRHPASHRPPSVSSTTRQRHESELHLRPGICRAALRSPRGAWGSRPTRSALLGASGLGPRPVQGRPPRTSSTGSLAPLTQPPDPGRPSRGTTPTVFVPELLWVEASLGAVVVLLYGAAVVTALWHQDPVRRLDARLVMALMTGRSYLHKGGEEHVAAVEPPEATRDEGTGTPPSGSSGQ